MQNHSYENEFCMQFHFHANKGHSHMKGSALRLHVRSLMKQMHLRKLRNGLFFGFEPGFNCVGISKLDSNSAVEIVLRSIKCISKGQPGEMLQGNPKWDSCLQCLAVFS